jgi:hypothetical protein
MAYDPKRIDMRGEPRARGFKDIGVSDDGKWARIAFVGLDLKTEIPIHIAADLIGKMLPILLGADAECTRRRKGTIERQVYKIKEGHIQQTEADNIVFDFIIPTGQHFAFEVDKIGAKLLLSALSQILGLVERQSGTVDPPRRH